MKYGLSRDDKLPGSRKRWKITMEHEINSLKFELLLLKEQLHESTNKIKQLTAANAPGTSDASKEFSSSGNDKNNIRIEFTIKNEENVSKVNHNALKTPSWPAKNEFTFKNEENLNKENQFSLKTQSWPTKIGPFAPFVSGEKLDSASGKDNNVMQFPVQNVEHVDNKNQFSLKTSNWPTNPSVAPCTTVIGWNLLNCNTRSVQFQATIGDVETSQNVRVVTRFQYITAMPAYQNWSTEELRWQDYAVAQSHHHQQFTNFGLKGVFSGTELTRFYPTWGSDPVTKVPTSHQCITALPLYQDKTFEELRLEDYILKSMVVLNQLKHRNKLRPARTTRRTSLTWSNLENKGIKINNDHVEKNQGCWPANETDNSMITEQVEPQKPSSFVFRKDYTIPCTWELESPYTRSVIGHGDTTFQQEHSLSQVLLEFKNIARQLSTMNNHQLNIDAHLSEMRSRLSVMDSRLSAVDMSMKVQEVNNKWHLLKPTLANLSNTSTQIETKTLPAATQTEGTSIYGEESDASPWSSHTTVAVMSDGKSFSERDTLNMDISSFPQDMCSVVSASIENTSLTANLSSRSPKQMSTSEPLLVDNVEERSLNNSKVRNDDSVDKPLTTSIDLEQESEKNSQHLHCVKNDINTQIDGSTNSSNKTNPTVCENNLEVNSEQQAVDIPENILNKTESAVLLTECEVANKQQTSTTNELKVTNEESNSDLESEYVIVEKTDTFDFIGQNSEGQCSVVTESSSSGFKICGDITEYLEVNLGKKKNAVYEFGFEANPDFSPIDAIEASSVKSENDTDKDGSKECPSQIPTKDDSFQNFLTSLVKDSSIKLKQSSPFTLTPKKPKTSQEEQDTHINPVVNDRLILKTRRRIASKSTNFRYSL